MNDRLIKLAEKHYNLYKDRSNDYRSGYLEALNMLGLDIVYRDNNTIQIVTESDIARRAEELDRRKAAQQAEREAQSTFTNLDWLEQEGIDYQDIDATSLGDDAWLITSPLIGPVGTMHGCPTKLGAVLGWFAAEHELTAELTDEETSYLHYVLKPLRSRVLYIEKTKATGTTEYIYVVFKDDTDMEFPTFPAGTMYSGLLLNTPYTLTELGL